MNKINQILQEWPKGTVITTQWLRQKGVSRQLIDSYKKSGWMESVGVGAYIRPNDDLTWEGALYALQVLDGYELHVGGKSALAEHGLAHYITKNQQETVVLWKPPSERVPAWFSQQEWEDDITIRSANLFDQAGKYTSKPVNGVKLQISSPEQAFMEYLYDIPKYESWDEMNYLAEGLVSLRPSEVQQLLEHCTSVKVKRLFLYLADYYSHPWFNKLDLSEVDLGSGKRQIMKGGSLNKKYQITVLAMEREER